MLRRLKRLLLTVLAALFLVEAWLWDHLEPLVARLVAVLPLRAFKAWFAAEVGKLSPPATLIVFAAPVVLLFPFKLLGLWLIAHKHWVLAALSLLAAKLMGLGVTAYVFDVTRPKLMRMAWFRAVYDTVMGWRAWAHRLVDPYREALRAKVRALKERYGGRALELLRRLRRQVRAERQP
ncbi:MAG: hypothetical protein EPO23_14690 [Xanthobacteraceae bacterium]|nr:MAG: hypothetical protein EPO23_14690 [Xanthobacteraceae bacterium]